MSTTNPTHAVVVHDAAAARYVARVAPWLDKEGARGALRDMLGRAVRRREPEALGEWIWDVPGSLYYLITRAKGLVTIKANHAIISIGQAIDTVELFPSDELHEMLLANEDDTAAQIAEEARLSAAIAVAEAQEASPARSEAGKEAEAARPTLAELEATRDILRAEVQRLQLAAGAYRARQRTLRATADREAALTEERRALRILLRFVALLVPQSAAKENLYHELRALRPSLCDDAFWREGESTHG